MDNERASSGPPPVIDGYTYVQKLGQGAFADVHQYAQKYTNRLVAVKVMRAPLDGLESGQAFDSEVSALAELSSHPCIVTLYAAGRTDQRQPYLVMEYCALESLDHLVGDPAALTLQDKLRLTVMLCGAVETLHKRGFVHADIKPHNILLTEYKTPKLADFGIVAIRGEDRVERGYSAPWAAPEVLADDAPVTAASDVYGVAATLYTLLAGHAPNVVPGMSNSVDDIVERSRSQSPPPLAARAAPAEVSRVMSSALDRDPARRPRSARELGRLLNEAQRSLGFPETAMHVAGAHETTLSVASGTPEEGQHTVRRERRVNPAALEDDRTVRRPRTAPPVVGLAGGAEPPLPVVRTGRGSVEDNGRGRRRATSLAALVLAAVVLLGGLVLAGSALFGDSAGDVPTAGDPKKARAERRAPRAAPSSSSPAETPASFRCWDGQVVATKAVCTLPFGVEGLTYIFPELVPSRCEITSTPSRFSYYDCRRALGDGTVVEVHYTRWRYAEQALQHYDKGGQRTVLASENGSGERLAWFSNRSGLYKVALMYRDQPWSATAYTSTEADRDEAMRTLLEMRPRDEVYGVPAR